MTTHGMALDQLMDLEQGTWTPHRPRRTRRGILIVLAVALTLVPLVGAAIANHERVADAVYAVCTIGEPDGATCSDAMVRVGYP